MVEIRKRPFRLAVRILGILTAILMLASGCGKGGNSSNQISDSSENIVMYLDGDAVSAEEYEMLVKEYCNQIYMQYTTDQVNREGFWEEEIDGNVPYMQLEDIILEELRGNYAIKRLAVELDVTDDYTYEDLLESMEDENDNGADASGEEVSYGLSSFDEASYYKYWYSNLETQVQSALIKEKIKVSQDDCKAYYEEHQEEFTYETGVSLLYAEIPCDSETQNQDAQATAMGLKRAMESTDSVEELEEAFDNVMFENLELNSLDTQTGTSGVYAQRWEIASQMTEGEVYGPYEANGALCVMRCTGRTENGTIDFEAAMAQIERYLQVQNAQEMIVQEADGLKVKSGDITAKDIILRTISP